MAAPYFASPSWNQGWQFFDNNGNVLANGKIHTYEGGQFTVDATTYTLSTGTPNDNPIILDADGRVTKGIWLESGTLYNFRLTDSNDNALEVVENVIAAEPTTSGGSSTNVNVWNSVPTPQFVSSTQFLVPGNFTVQFAVGNRVQFINGITVFGYGTVTAVAASGGNTQVTVVNDSTPIASNLSAVYWSSLTVNGYTVDAGAVAYTTSLPYSNPATVGGQLKLIINAIATDTLTVAAGTGLSGGGAVGFGGTVTLANTGVLSFNGRSGAVTLTSTDVDTALGYVITPPIISAATTNLVRTGSSGANNQPDPDLTITLASGHTYKFEIFVRMFAPAAGVFQGIGYTGTFATQSCFTSYYGAGVGQGGGGVNGTLNINGQYTYAAGITSQTLIIYQGYITTTSAGNLSLTWGNTGAGSNTMTRYAGANMVVTQVI